MVEEMSLEDILSSSIVEWINSANFTTVETMHSLEKMYPLLI